MARGFFPSNIVWFIISIFLAVYSLHDLMPAVKAESMATATPVSTGKTTETLRIERLNSPKVFTNIVYNDASQTLDLCMPAETNTAQAFPLPAKSTTLVAASKTKTTGKPTGYLSQPPVRMTNSFPRKNIKRTAVIFVHGGSFRAGRKEQMLSYCKLFAQAGFLSVTINYRLAPTYLFPTAQQDVEDSVLWLQSKASHYGFDPAKVVLVGYSAGGNLALMASTKINMVHKSANTKAITSSVYPVAGVIAMAAPTNFETLANAMPSLKADVRRYLNGASPKSASPAYYVSSNSPPTFLIHGDQDSFVPVSQSREYQDILKSLNVPVKLQVYPGVDHNVFKSTPQLSQILRDMTAFLIYVENKSVK